LQALEAEARTSIAGRACAMDKLDSAAREGSLPVNHEQFVLAVLPAQPSL
jgi:hypothetical protein